MNLGIDLGTANTLVYVKGKKIVLNEPSVVAINLHTNKIEAVGNEAKKMIGKTPANIVAIRPLKDGVIADYETTAKMLEYFIQQSTFKLSKWFSTKPNVMVGIPSGITPVEKMAIQDATKLAGARAAYTIEEPFAAAIGAGLPVWEAQGNMVVDIGGGTTEIAIISLGGIVVSHSIKVAGDKMDESIISYVKRKYNVLIGEKTSESLKMQIGSAVPLDEEETMEIKGMNLVTGLPEILTISSHEITQSLSDAVEQIVEAVKYTLEKCPPELASDIMDQGIVLAGGGALLRNLDQLLEMRTHVPIHIADDPLLCVAIGTGKALENLHLLKSKKGITMKK